VSGGTFPQPREKRQKNFFITKFDRSRTSETRVFPTRLGVRARFLIDALIAIFFSGPKNEKKNLSCKK